VTRTTLMLALALVMVGACSSSDDEVAPLGPPVDRLVVVDGSEVVTMTPDGADRTVIHDGEGAVPFQPIWSHDGEQIAFSSITDGTDFSVSVAAADGSGVVSDEAIANVFYMQWSPSSDRLGTLRNHVEGGVALDVVTVGEDGLETTEVDDGDSYYFVWSPDGADMAVHVGSGRFETWIDGEFDSIEDTPASFQAPIWTDEGIYGVRKTDGSVMVTRYDPDGEGEDLVEVAGPTSFHVSPDGRRIVLQSLSSADGVEVAWRVQPAVDQRLPGNRVYVVDVESGEVTEVMNRLVTGFWWSPDGERLAILYLPEGSRSRMIWRFWEDGTLTDGPEFTPLSTWVTDLIPFVDQYNRSMTPWSPDSGSLAFPGTIDGDPGIWVTEIDGETTKVSDGTWVAWSRS